jgi:hypothetical protein
VTREQAQALAGRENAKGRPGARYEVAGPEDEGELEFDDEPKVTPFHVRRVTGQPTTWSCRPLEIGAAARTCPIRPGPACWRAARGRGVVPDRLQ